MKTLLLDDNLMTQTRVEAQLRNAGCEVLTRRSLPPEADFAFVLINLGSRSMPGLELLEKAKVAYPEAKIWAYCGHLEIEIRRSAIKIGVDRLLTNEVAMSELSGVVQTSFQSA
ncbi:response regulator [bacterium]|nr:MAG: response regulator [bacterium]